jgi:hypothetical protein
MSRLPQLRVISERHDRGISLQSAFVRPPNTTHDIFPHYMGQHLLVTDIDCVCLACLHVTAHATQRLKMTPMEVTLG